MTAEYTLDPELAKKAGQSLRISETGLYIGTITNAFACKSTQGTKGVELMFKADDGRTADYLQIWTRKQDGTSLMGEQVLHAIMTCTEQKSLTLQKGRIERGNKTFDAEIFPELRGKRIAFLLQKEPYRKSDGTTGDSMLIYLPLEADTKRTAKEKLERAASGEHYKLTLSSLKDRPMREAQTAQRPSQASAAASHVDDDIPF